MSPDFKDYLMPQIPCEGLRRLRGSPGSSPNGQEARTRRDGQEIGGRGAAAASVPCHPPGWHSPLHPAPRVYAVLPAVWCSCRGSHRDGRGAAGAQGKKRKKSSHAGIGRVPRPRSRHPAAAMTIFSARGTAGGGARRDTPPRAAAAARGPPARPARRAPGHPPGGGRRRRTPAHTRPSPPPPADGVQVGRPPRWRRGGRGFSF